MRFLPRSGRSSDRRTSSDLRAVGKRTMAYSLAAGLTMRNDLALFLMAFSLASGCKAARSDPAPEASTASAASADVAPPASTGLLYRRRLTNRVAYIPPQCFTKTRGDDGKPKNPCYACHTRSEPPNFVDDEDLQLTLKLPPPAGKNPWTNLLSPPVEHAPPMTDEAVLHYVRQSNYFDADGSIALAGVLEKPPPDWDINRNGRWDGYTPDVEYAFDDQGFDHRRDGTPTGWRAFAYYPFLGTFFPTNGSADDVLVRLDPALREDADEHYDQGIYTVNLAVVEALVTRADVAIDPVDEKVLGVDLDLDGRLGTARRVAFDAVPNGHGQTRMHYVGHARALQDRGEFPVAVGLFPLRTEFFHTVRYLDVGADGVVTMASRMKELRYAKKVRWLNYQRLTGQAALETRITATAPDRTHGIEWLRELGVSNEAGWYFQGFIEDRDGALRPQSMEESAFCEGCHGGIGATVDSTFAFARKLGATAPARGWFHWSQHGLGGLPEPKRRDGQYEYTLYLREAGAGDEIRSNSEILDRFFDAQGGLRPAEVERLHSDIGRLLLPSAARALDLDRAYRAVVLEQSYDRGRDAVLARSANVFAEPPVGEKTGIVRPVVAMRLAR
jgi:hypothetical protein